MDDVIFEKIDRLRSRFNKAKQRRSLWEDHWKECYEFALPQRDGLFTASMPGERKTDRLFDGTAPDAVDQLAASLLARLTPPWSSWFGLKAGSDLSEEEQSKINPAIDKITKVMKSNFERSNFAVEMHQCYLDLVTTGTASLMLEEAEIGGDSAFRFTAVPLSELVVEEGNCGKLDVTFRRFELSALGIKSRFRQAKLPLELEQKLEKDPDQRLAVIEAVTPAENGFGYDYIAFLEQADMAEGEVVLKQGYFAGSPFITFRWLKVPGEIYGRSPVMKALPDIKTANKVVELILKNATIAVTGIWQADDDGVLNPANVKLVPGTIIPKAVGSKGLSPLEAPGKFDISQLVLDDLRKRISHALLADKLGQVNAPTMTATEVLERSAEMARVLGATYGRLQSELLNPLIMRAISILKRRGELPDIVVDGNILDLQYLSPLAMQQSREDASNTMTWLQSVQALGPNGMNCVDISAVTKWLARALGVPSEMVRDKPVIQPLEQILEEVDGR